MKLIDTSSLRDRGERSTSMASRNTARTRITWRNWRCYRLSADARDKFDSSPLTRSLQANGVFALRLGLRHRSFPHPAAAHLPSASTCCFNCAKMSLMSENSDWGPEFHRALQLRLWASATPAQRFAWLEEMLDWVGARMSKPPPSERPAGE